MTVAEQFAFCYISTYYTAVPDHFSTGPLVLQGLGNGFINLMKVDCGLPLTNLQSYVLRLTFPSPSTKLISGGNFFIFKGVCFSMSSVSVIATQVDTKMFTVRLLMTTETIETKQLKLHVSSSVRYFSKICLNYLHVGY